MGASPDCTGHAGGEPISINSFDGFVSEAAKHQFESRYWIHSYPPRVPTDIPPLRHTNLLELMQESLQKFSSQVAFVSAGSEFTYQQVDALSEQFAGYLHSIGVKAGDVVALMMPNCVQFPVCFLGALKLGCVVTNINPLYTSRELNHQLRDSAACLLVVFESFAYTAQNALEGTQIEHMILTQLGDLFGGVKGPLLNFVLRKVKRVVPVFSLPQAVPLLSALSKGKAVPFPKPRMGLDDTAILQYTGGTTGVSRGAMLSHRNLLSNLEQGLAWMKEAVGQAPVTIVTMLPLYHIYALVVNCILFMTLGARNVLIANPRDVRMVVKVLRRERFHVLTAVNTLFNAFLNNKEFCNRDFSDLKLVLSGGMALQQAIAERWYLTTGCPIAEGYGLTETSPVVCVPPFHGEKVPPIFRGTVGVPIVGTNVRLRREDGLWVGAGELGEICVKGPQVMKGYLNCAEETASSIDSQGWFATGDIGVMDEHGFLKIVDRKKDMIIVSGFNVYPNEVEDVVAQHEGVLECAVVGVHDPVCGERVKLVVVKKQSDLSKDDLIVHCREYLTAYKVPSVVEFRDSLPKTLVGKILRRELRS